jgi:hypothetical protein
MVVTIASLADAAGDPLRDRYAACPRPEGSQWRQRDPLGPASASGHIANMLGHKYGHAPHFWDLAARKHLLSIM